MPLRWAGATPEQQRALDILGVIGDLVAELHDLDPTGRSRAHEVVDARTSWPAGVEDLARALFPGGYAWDWAVADDAYGRVGELQLTTIYGGHVQIDWDGRVSIEIEDPHRQLARRRSFWVAHTRELPERRLAIVAWLREQRRKGRVLPAAAALAVAVERGMNDPALRVEGE